MNKLPVILLSEALSQHNLMVSAAIDSHATAWETGTTTHGSPGRAKKAEYDLSSLRNTRLEIVRQAQLQKQHQLDSQQQAQQQQAQAHGGKHFVQLVHA